MTQMVLLTNLSGLQGCMTKSEEHIMGKVTTICYRQKREWDSREEAENFFLEGVMCCEGSERDRYATILSKLMSGRKVCSDED